MYRADKSSQNMHHPPTPPKYLVNGNMYHRHENGSTSRQCSVCGRWIGLGPKGGEWSFQLHVNSTSCAKEREKKVATRPVSKSTSYTEVPTSPLSPFTTPTSLALAYPFAPGPFTSLPHQFIPSAPCSLAGPLPLTPGSRPPHLIALDPPPPSLGTSSWSAPGSPQICSTPSYIRSHTALPSLALESAWCPQWSAVPPLAQKMCPGSLVLWEPGDPATTYPFNLHHQDLKSPIKLPWTVAVGERPGSLRLWSDNCTSVCDPSQSCCHSCAEITPSTRYQQVEDRAKNDSRHRAYDKLSWEQMAGRTREKGDLLAKERSKV